MRIPIILIIFFLNIITIYAQNNLNDFKRDILLDENYSLTTYEKYINHYNNISYKNEKEFQDYFSNIKFLSTNQISKNIKDVNKLKFINISNNTDSINKYLSITNRNIAGYHIYLVCYNNNLLSSIIYNDKNEIISFFSKLNKKNNKIIPWFFDEPILK